ncbi:chromosome segregation protein SMC [Fusobacterium pseudoperiodonticum]|uniref:Chromosome partition protein Smc n=1 Tax=Fusobacterium pseudoperiodonticum TaxID=2663009 RepID=A0AAD0F268_9FUSO|nr:chromosome segregation protein SMC [Fusobacterium pseudoperiodonticum]ATV34683.1 chromosome segregation protein SMC [Fusobacterium pseudoperiodonticum]ATV62424.1 chromosome segregation protein SMC [Fusobacterium pseudoperiodonticum]
MYLKAVEINGFKSFGEKVYIDFNRGITSIVGPNGSGKSNILDAVLWVLGEQSYKNIRAKESQDVIFSGGKEKKAATKAEVSLIIDNSDRYLDFDNDIVKITRRIHITGENEYLINDSKSRLKEIGNLFLDTGIGKTAYSVIGQGKVERIINSSPKEIKNIIEEAAGIKKLQANRLEAQKNLGNIEVNLDKVEFILNETRENKNKIEKQAELAQKYIDLKDEKSSLAKGIYITELEQKEKNLVENEDIKIKSEEECSILQEKFDKTLNRLTTIDLEKEEVKKQKILIDSRNKELKDVISTKETEQAVTRERLDNFKKDKLLKEEYSLHLENKIEKKLEEINILIAKKEELSKNILEMEAANKEFERKINELEAIKVEKTDLIESRNKKIRDLELEKQLSSNEIENNERKLKSSLDEVEILKKELDEITKKEIANNEEKDLLNSQIKAKQEELAKTEERNEFLVNQLSEISKTINKLSQDIREYEYQEKTSSGKLEALIRMEESNEGFFKSVKEVLNSGISGIDGVLISLIKFDDKLAKAIEAAVSGNLQDIIVEDKEVAKKCIAFLTERKLGRASFLALDTIKVSRREFKGNMPGVLGLAADLVSAEDKYKKVVDFVFGGLLIVENIDVATDILNKNLFAGNIVTVNGELVSSRGRITGGENQKSSINQIFERKKEIKVLEEKVSNLKSKIVEESKRREDLSIKLENYENEIDKIDSLEDNIRKKMELLKKDFENLSEKSERISKELRNIKFNIDDAEKYKTSYQDRINSSVSNIEEIEKHINSLRKDLEADELTLKETLANIDELNKQFSDTRIIFLNNKNSIEQYERDIISKENENSDLKEEKEKNSNVVIELSQNIEELEKNEEQLQKEIEEHIRIYNSENRDIEVLNERENNLSNEERELSKDKSKLETDLLHSNDRLEKITEVIEKIKTDIENINEKLTELTDVTAKAVEVEKLKSSKDYLRSLENKINNFGDVNLLAINEFKELKEKYDYLARERDDVVKSRKQVMDLIQEIDERIHEDFHTTYENINENFNKMCEETIRNTEGRLNIINPEDFDNCGIEIFVKFKNKKKQPLSLLSGGEKSMVAIAFIMAIFMYKPSPFTFLDEIEAALDEKNTKNLLGKLRDFTDKSQFILITHNKETMKESDSIFGVTMNKEIGISKIVSPDKITKILDSNKESN